LPRQIVGAAFIHLVDSGMDDSELLDNEEGSVTFEIGQLKSGEEDAARQLWDRYYHRLVGLARMKLGDSSRRAMDEDDVVQNAFNSFCRDARAGRFPDLRDRESLWCLLAEITARKAANQRKHEARAKRGGGRSVNGTQPANAETSHFELLQIIEGEPSPEDASVFVSELARFMDALDDPRHRLILLWKLEERTNPEIARHLDCSLSTVEREVRSIRKRLQEIISAH
jgi:RNA polymerase sigma factor (sigma-70 family)